MTQVDAHRRSTRTRRGSSASAPSRCRAALNSALSGRTVTQLRDDIYLIDVQRPRRRRAIAAISRSLRDLEIGIASGNSVPLAQIATFEYGLEETIIWRRDRLPTITVQSKIADGLQPATVNGAAARSPSTELMRQTTAGLSHRGGRRGGRERQGLGVDHGGDAGDVRSSCCSS